MASSPVTRFVYPIETRRGSQRLQNLRELYLHLKAWADRHADVDDALQARLDGKLPQADGGRVGIIEFNLAVHAPLLQESPHLKEYCRTYRLDAGTQLSAVRQFLVLCEKFLLNEPRNECHIFEFTMTEGSDEHDNEARHQLNLKPLATGTLPASGWHCVSVLKPSAGKRYAS